MSPHEVFVFRSRIAAPAHEVLTWHLRSGAFERLVPPWETVHVIERAGGVSDGGTVTLRMHLGPIGLNWVAAHRDFVPDRSFTDEQIKGPFAYWRHTHEVISRPHAHAADHDSCELVDRIEYALPLGRLGQALGGLFVRRRLARMFAYRHRIVAEDLARHQAARRMLPAGKPLRVAIAGASGLLGTALTSFLRTGGHEVLHLVRREPHAVDEVRWAPEQGEIDAARLEGLDVLVNLAGENVGAGRWTHARKHRILQSRVSSTALLAKTVAGLGTPPRVWINASAIGIYGNQEAEALAFTEDSPPGTGFLAQVCRDWEAAALPAMAHGIRVVLPRFGVVLSPRGGALAKMLVPMRMGVGGCIGAGRQRMSWIGLDDAVDVMYRAMVDEQLRGPVNAVAGVVSNAALTECLGQVLRRPTRMPLPAPMVRLLFGEMGETMLLGSARVWSERLREIGFTFRQSQLLQALQQMLGETELAPAQQGSLAEHGVS